MKNKDSNQVNISVPNNSLIHEYYAKMPYWTKEEAVVILASSRDTLVSESFKYIRIMKRFKQGDNVIQNLHLLERAMEHYELPTKEQRDPDSSHYVMVFRPIDFIKWAKKKEVVLPDGLEELVSKYYVAADEDLRAKYKKLEAENQELKEIISKREEEEKPAHGNSVFTYQRIIFLLIKEAYATGNCEIKQKDFERYIAEFITSIESLRDNADIKLPFPEIPHEKTINSTFQDIINKLYKNNKHPKIKYVK